MNFLFIGIVTVLYVGQIVMLALTKQWPAAIMFLGFSIGNVGIMLGMK